MRKHFLTLFISLVAVTALATETLSPTLDISYRTNSTKNSWVSSTPILSSDAQVFELKWSSQFFAIQQYEIPNYAKAKKMTLTLSLGVQQADNPIAVWNFPYEMPENSSYDATKRGVFFSNVETVTGGLFSSTDGSFANQLAVSNCSENEVGSGKWVLEMNAAGLKPYSFKEDGTTAIIQLLVTTSSPNPSRQAKYQSNNESNDAANRPKLEVEYIDEYSNYPINDYNYRFNDSKGWNNGFPKLSDANDKFELTYTARLYVAQQYVIEDFSPANEYTLTVTSYGNNNRDAYVWDFPYELPCKNAYPSATLAGHIETVTGTDLTAGTPSINASSAIATTKTAASGNTYSFTIPGYKLTPVYVGDNKSVVTVLLTSTNNSHLYSGKAENGTNRSTLTRTGVMAYPIINTTQKLAEATLAEAVSNANANEVITLYDDVTVSSSSLEITKELTIQGATGEEKILCDVAANSIMVLADGNETDYTVTFKNLIVDGQNTERSIQTFDSNKKAKMCFDGVSFINTSYSIVCGDVKSSGSNILLVGSNSIPNGIYLNKNKRVDGQNAKHATPIKLYLANDYEDDWVAVLCTSDPSQYEAISADNSTGWQLYDGESGSCGHELKAKKCLQYDLEVKAAAKMATMVIGFDAALPEGVRAYQLVYDDSPEYADGICAYEESVISKNKPVLIIAEPGTYSFKSIAGATLDEQPDPTYGALKGVYASGTVPACTTGVYNYILTNGNDGVGFYQVADASNAIGAHRAYLSCGYNTQAGGGSAPRRMVINFDAHKTPTAVEQISQEPRANSQKLLIDGVIYIRKADHLYRIDGQLVK